MNIENILHKAKKYTEAVKDIEGARQKWQKKTKDTIFKTLETLIKETDIGLVVGINDEKINHETVYLGFENQPSGIEYNPDNPFNSIADRTGVLIKHGGAMYFSFLTNGRVLCWISYPYINEVIVPSNVKELQSFTLDELDEPSIAQMVEQFLDEMIKWEKHAQEEYPKVGFKTGEDEPQNAS